MNLIFFNILLANLFLVAGEPVPPHHPVPVESYRVENIEMPAGLHAATGAIDFLPDGRLIAAFLRGEIMIYNPQNKQWSLFAEGLQEPLGMMVVSNTEIIVMQRPELTRIIDTDNDGHADLYQTVSDEFGISGNYHEFNYGPMPDKEGNLFIALNSASTGGTIRKQVRGKINPLTLNRNGMMFSPVPYRGWVMKLTPQGKLLPVACGFRSPNGLGFDGKGNLFATENQGDWVGTSAMYHVKQGNFYGHPGGLVWKENWDKGIPYAIPLEELEKMKTKAAVLFPHGIIANSPSQPICDQTVGKFGPFSGQLLVGEMNKEEIVRVMLEEVDGELQGACIPFILGKGLRKGNNRLTFAPDGSLWVGQAIEQGWAGDKGIQRVVYTGIAPIDIHTMHLTQTGFDLTFTQPVDEKTLSNLNNYKFQRYYYEYHSKYGSDQFDLKDVPVTKVVVAPGGKKVSLHLQELKPGYVYQLNLEDIKNKQGQPLQNNLICYTLNKLVRKG